MDNIAMFVCKLAVYVVQLLHIKLIHFILVRKYKIRTVWLTNDVINGADERALSSLLLRLSQLRHNCKSCLLSRRKKAVHLAPKNHIFGSRQFSEKTAVLVSVLKTVTALVSYSFDSLITR